LLLGGIGLRRMALSVSADCRSFLEEVGFTSPEIAEPTRDGIVFAPVRGQMGAAKREDFCVRVGQEVEVSKTFGEIRHLPFCGITGGLSCNPVDEPGGKLVEG
jgi:hypothetical protein